METSKLEEGVQIGAASTSNSHSAGLEKYINDISVFTTKGQDKYHTPDILNRDLLCETYGKPQHPFICPIPQS